MLTLHLAGVSTSTEERQNCSSDVTDDIRRFLKAAVTPKWQGGRQFPGHMQNV